MPEKNKEEENKEDRETSMEREHEKKVISE